MDTFFDVGLPLDGGATALTAPLATRAYRACGDDRRFTIIGFRRHAGTRPGDVIVVDCKNDGVPSKISRGIQYVERLALVFPQEATCLPEVWALRRDFPATEHQNANTPGSPASLCLYFEPWRTVARTWTGRKHLERVVRWLADVAAGELHRANQPVEQFYFQSPWELVVPPAVRSAGVPADHVLAVHKIDPIGTRKGLLLSSLVRRNQNSLATPVSAAVITVAPVVGGQIERPVCTLGELAAQLERRGSDLVRPLVDALDRLTEGDGIRATAKEVGLLILRIPIQRTSGGEVERFQVQGFLLEQGLGPLGEALNMLRRNGDRYFRAVLLNGDRYNVGNTWRGTLIHPVAILDGLDLPRARQLTGVDAGSADFAGVIVGAGSLGGQLAEIWGREGWGAWTIIDEDLVKPHNVPRHRALYGHIGLPKAQAVTAMVSEFFPTGVSNPRAIVKDATASDEDVRSALTGANLIVDVSTTLYVPRDFAQQSDLPRLASAFLTPAGQASVLLLEDAARVTRLDALEAQYYRAIVRRDWGSTHLAGHRARELWVGAGCREVTTVLAPDLVALHAGTLGRRLRRVRNSNSAYIGVWHHNDDTGALGSDIVLPALGRTAERGGWHILWDEEVETTVREFRRAALPNETGGILVGYIDQMLKTIYVVDALPPPADSVGTHGSFARGVDGLRVAVEQASERTAGVVGYIGEWHSHPDGHSIRPSGYDVMQLCFLAAHLRHDGHPALMMIVGEHEEGFVLGEIE